MNSSRFATATHVLVALEYLRRAGVDRFSSRRLAKSVGTNSAVVRELLRDLRNAKLIVAIEGRGGGVRIDKPANQITLRSVHSAVADEPVLGENLRPIYEACPVSCAIKDILKPVYQSVHGAVLSVLDQTKLSDLVDQVPVRSHSKRTQTGGRSV